MTNSLYRSAFRPRAAGTRAALLVVVLAASALGGCTTLLGSQKGADFRKQLDTHYETLAPGQSSEAPMVVV